MPNSANAKKRHRQNLRSRDRNRAMKSDLKSQVRKLLESLNDSATTGDVTSARENLRLVAKKADRAAAARTIHPNRAARMKSRLSARILAASKAVSPA